MFPSSKGEEQRLKEAKKENTAQDDNDSIFKDVFDALHPSLIHLCIPSCTAASCVCGGCCNVFSVGNVVLGHAFDFILVRSDTDRHLISCSDAIYSFNSFLGIPNYFVDLKSSKIYLEIENRPNVRFPIEDGKLQAPQGLDEKERAMEKEFRARMKREVLESGSQQVSGAILGDHDSWALQKLTEFCTLGTATPARIVVRVLDRTIGVAPCHIYFWSASDRILVCDIDGTITKSNVGGIWDSIVVQQYRYCHDNVCRFLNSVLEREQDAAYRHRPAIRILYLSSRPLGLAFATRKFLQNLRQPQSNNPKISGSVIGLPRGPLVGYTGNILGVLHMELITHSVHEFKSKALRSVVHQWKQVSGGKDVNPFLAGLGNTFMDAQAYHEAGMDLNQIYIINKKSEIRCLDRVGAENPLKKVDYPAAQNTLFALGYSDKNIVRHILRDASV